VKIEKGLYEEFYERAEVIVFFATPDLLAGLFTLTNYAA
jgi:hypothetical protein